ncbi:MAG: ComF family protein [Firmicutes bacterium]|nr:ComF family protein [Bacillota bacterium]
MIGIIKFLIDMIYPPRCVVCQEIIMPGNYLCDACIKHNSKNTGIYVKNINNSKSIITGYITCAFAVYDYKFVKKSIKSFKFDGYKFYGEGFSKIMFETAQKNFPNIFSDSDIIIPVPIHKKRFKKRGFNQSVIMGRGIARLAGIEFSEKALIRKTNTIPQSGLSIEERLKNIKNAFEIGNCDIKGKNILLIDDIFTTGATLNECAKVLKENGAKEILCYTFSATILS